MVRGNGQAVHSHFAGGDDRCCYCLSTKSGSVGSARGEVCLRVQGGTNHERGRFEVEFVKKGVDGGGSLS